MESLEKEDDHELEVGLWRKLETNVAADDDDSGIDVLNNIFHFPLKDSLQLPFWYEFYLPPLAFCATLLMWFIIIISWVLYSFSYFILLLLNKIKIF